LTLYLIFFFFIFFKKKSPDSWKGGNTSTKKIGYFPRHFVEVIAESFQFIKSYDDFDPLESLQQAEDQNSLSKDHRIKVSFHLFYLILFLFNFFFFFIF